ncbi:MAG: hypothetical protein NVS9B1_11840 [Candidatus Dormibacteraceae bacterium]
MTEPAGFRFDFADLFPTRDGDGPPVALKVIEGGADLPAEAHSLSPRPLPRWLPPLLPFLPAGLELRAGVAVSAAPAFGAMLRDSLAGIFAAAGAGCGIEVATWEQGFVVGCHGLSRMPATASVHLVAADLARASLSQAAVAIALLPPERTLLVLNGRLPRLERWLGLPPATAIRRLPLVGRAELDAARRGLPAGLGGRRFGRGCLELAVELMRRHRAELP